MSERAITVLLQAITGPYEAAMGRASAKTAAFGTAAQGTARTGSGLGTMFGGLSGKLLAGGGLVYGLTQGAQLLMSYEDALVGVGKTTGLTGAELEALGDELTGLAGKIKGSAEDMLGIAQTAAQLGVANGDIVEFTEVIANMASATDLTVDSAATDMARLSNILGRPISEVEALGSTIVALGNTMATTEPEILSLAMRLAAAGRTAGFTDAEVVGLAAAMSELGIEAEAGGTAMSRVMNEITRQVGTGGDNLALFAQTAQMSVDQFVEAWSTDPAEALTAFMQGLGSLSEGDAFTVMEDLGLDAARLTDVLLRTSGGADGLAEAFDSANEAMRENKALAEEAAAANATASAAWDNLKDSVADFGRTAAGGSGGTSLLTETLKGLTAAVDNANEVLFRSPGTDSQTMFGRLFEDLDEFFRGPAGLLQGALLGDWELYDESWMSSAYMARQELEANARASGALTADMVLLNTAASNVGDTFGDAASAADGLAGSQDSAADAAAELMQRNMELADVLSGQLGPVFSLASAIEAADDAQKNLADTQADGEATAEDLSAAEWELFEALNGVTEAALRSGDGFDTAVAQVWAMHDAGEITFGTATRLVEQLHAIKTTADQLNGDYRMNLALDLSPADRVLLGRLESFATSGGGYSYDPDATGGGSGGSSGGSAPTNARAMGGPVGPDGMYLVGENGPELFTPSTAGRIVPAGQTAGLMGGTSQQIVNNNQQVHVTQQGGNPYDDAYVFLRREAIRTGHG